MEGEYFHIALTDDAKPFCIHTPHTIPFALRDKLKDELDLLQEQNIIAPVTEPTVWCALSWSHLRGELTESRCVSISTTSTNTSKESDTNVPLQLRL